MIVSKVFLPKDIGTERLKRHSVAEMKVHTDLNKPFSTKSANILPSGHGHACISSPDCTRGQERDRRQRKQSVFSNNHGDGQKHPSLMQLNDQYNETIENIQQGRTAQFQEFPAKDVLTHRGSNMSSNDNSSLEAHQVILTHHSPTSLFDEDPDYAEPLDTLGDEKEPVAYQKDILGKTSTKFVHSCVS